ncbi:hypothetical protein Tco_0827252 [Tanacetum coccineum]
MTSIQQDLDYTSVLDSCFISSTVSEVKRNLLKIGQIELRGKAILETFGKRSLLMKAFQDMLQAMGEDNPTHAYYKWIQEQVKKTMKIQAVITSIKDEENSKTKLSACGSAWKTIYLYLYLFRTL